MAKPKLPYVGDAALRRFLDRYACPTPFHMVRMRFWGEIVSPLLGASPIRTVEGLWPDGLPVFDGADEANRFFQTLLGLWNRMARHQDGAHPVALAKLPRLDPVDRESLSRALVIRTEELNDGFMRGFCGNDDGVDVPAEVRPLLERVEQGIELLYRMRRTLEAPPGPDDGALTTEIAQGLRAVDPLIQADLNQIAAGMTDWRKRQMEALPRGRGRAR